MINLKESVAKLMTKDMLTLGPQSSLLEAADIFDLKHIHHIPVVDDGQLVGLISKTDFLFFRHRVEGADANAQELKRLEQTTVDTVMAKNVSCLSPSQTIEDALGVFKDNYFHALPVVKEKKLQGIITPMDIMKYVVKNISN